MAAKSVTAPAPSSMIMTTASIASTARIIARRKATTTAAITTAIRLCGNPGLLLSSGPPLGTFSLGSRAVRAVPKIWSIEAPFFCHRRQPDAGRRPGGSLGSLGETARRLAPLMPAPWCQRQARLAGHKGRIGQSRTTSPRGEPHRGAHTGPIAPARAPRWGSGHSPSAGSGARGAREADCQRASSAPPLAAGGSHPRRGGSING